MKKLQWQIPDLLDLEYFIQKDKKIAQQYGIEFLKKRDRQLYLREIKPQLQSPLLKNQKNMLLLWVRALRREALERKEECAGKIWQQFDWLIGFLLVILGLISGASTVLSILAYSGNNPVNIFEFFFFTVIGPWSFLLLAAFLKLFKITDNVGGVASTILLKIFKKFLHHLQSKAENFARSHDDLGNLIGQIWAKFHKYKGIFASYALYKLQFFTISFGLACLLTLLVKVCFFDLAFGWQTSLSVGPEFLKNIVRIIAAPWSWFLPEGVAYPTLEEIEGTKIVLKNGIQALRSNDLVSWWPFLAMSIVTYSILLRILLFVFAKWRLQKHLNEIRFSSPVYLQIVSRMLTPVVEKAGEEDVRDEDLGKADDGVADQPSRKVSQVVRAEKNSLVFLPKEIAESISSNDLKTFLSNFGLTEFAVYNLNEPLIDIEGSINRKLLNLLRENQGIPLIVLAQEAWQPPLQEFISFVKTLRKTFPDVAVVIALTGMPCPDGRLVPPTHDEIAIWKRKIAGLGDEDLLVEELIRC